MNYIHIFNKYILIEFIIYGLTVLGIVFFCISDIPFESEPRVKNLPNLSKIKLYTRVGLVSFEIIVTIVVMLPLYKDKVLLSQNKYECRSGIACQEVYRSGLYGLFKSIIVETDGEKFNYEVIYADKEIKKGDLVKVTFLPNSTYSIVEKIE